MLSRGVLKFEVSFVLVGVMLESEILCGFMRLCGNIWFVKLLIKLDCLNLKHWVYSLEDLK